MSWDNFKVLLEIGRGGSLSAAAQVLGINQSTAGRKLSALEAELGTILVVRSKTGFVLTQAGEAAMKHAARIETNVNAMVDEVATADHGVVGTVRILGNAWTLDRMTKLAMADFLKAQPRLNIRIVTLSPRLNTRGEATLGLWFEVKPKPGEFSVKLGDVPYAVYHSAKPDAETRAWVVFYDEDAERPKMSNAIEQLRKSHEPIRMTATDASVLATAVSAGVGKGLLPMCLAEGDKRLVRVGSGAPELSRTLWMHCHPDTVETERMKATIEWLREVFDKVYLPDDSRAGTASS